MRPQNKRAEGPASEPRSRHSEQLLHCSYEGSLGSTRANECGGYRDGQQRGLGAVVNPEREEKQNSKREGGIDWAAAELGGGVSEGETVRKGRSVG